MVRRLSICMLAFFTITAICAACRPAAAGGPEPFPPAEAEEVAHTGDIQGVPTVEAGISRISKYGNITLTIGAETMTALGYEPADIVSVKIGGAEMMMPIGTDYSDADSGEPICRFKTDPEDEDSVVLAMNSGSLAEVMGIAEWRRIDKDPGYEWVYLNGLDGSVTVRISMAEKQGFAEEYAMHKLGNTRTNGRDDYAELSDAEYANFRAVQTTGMSVGTLFRSSSPIDPSLNRNAEADAALFSAQIRTVMNMCDGEEAMKRYAGFGQTYYSECDIIALDMNMDFASEDFGRKLSEGFRFIASHDGPYLIHCVEGKDRTGFAAAVLECLMGASADEVTADYMRTYQVYYGIAPGTAQYGRIAASNIESTLARMFGIGSIREEGADLRACARRYLGSIGMREDEIAALEDRLGKGERVYGY